MAETEKSQSGLGCEETSLVELANQRRKLLESINGERQTCLGAKGIFDMVGVAEDLGISMILRDAPELPIRELNAQIYRQAMRIFLEGTNSERYPYFFQHFSTGYHMTSIRIGELMVSKNNQD
jgi:hypothetical protein